MEGVNRKVYKFNTTVDKYVVKPVADGYVYITPKPVQAGVTNFFTNLTNINVVLNDLLQGKVKQGFADTGRFALNSTLGLLGLFDVATHVGLEQHEEDFGQTLGVWGVAPGPYLVLPFLGPTTLRETPAYAVDAVTNPVLSAYPPLLILDAVDSRARAEGALKFIDEAALDPYVFTRESYLQWREYQVHDGNPPTQDAASEFEEFEDFEDVDAGGGAAAPSEAASGADAGGEAGQASSTAPTECPETAAEPEDAAGKRPEDVKTPCAAEPENAAEATPPSEPDEAAGQQATAPSQPPVLDDDGRSGYPAATLTHSPQDASISLHQKLMQSK